MSAPARLGLDHAQVLAAAWELMREGGPERLTMRRLGDRLGCAAMSLYYYVDSRDDLLLGLVEQAHGPAVAARLATNLDLPVAAAALHLLVAVLADETTDLDPTVLLDALALEAR